MRVLCLTDWPIAGQEKWLWNSLAQYEDEVEFLYILPQSDKFARWGKIFTYYPAFWGLAYRALKKTERGNFDVVLGFEGKNGIPYGFLRRLRGQTRPRLVVMYFSLKGIIMNFLPFARYAMKGIDHIILPTTPEMEYYHRLLGYPLGQMTRLDLGTYDSFSYYSQVCRSRQGEYIFAGGRSERDYRTLIQAIAGLDVQVVINARKFNLAGIRLPGNVKLNDIMPLGRFVETITHSKFVVVPTRNVVHAAGLTQIIYAMAAGKAVIASRTPGVVEYVDETRTGLLVEPGNAAEMRQAIQYLLDHPDEADQMGEAGRRKYERRYTFPSMSQGIRDVLVKVHEMDAHPAASPKNEGEGLAALD